MQPAAHANEPKGMTSAVEMRLRLALTLLALPCALAIYDSFDDVVQLTPSNFKEHVLQATGVAAVEFYAPWCGHCKSLAPHWRKAASNLKGLATIAAVDCDNQANKALCAQMQVQGFPTIKLFGPDQQKNPYTGEVTKEPQDYFGARTAKGVSDAVLGLLSDVHVTKVSSASELKEFVSKQTDTPKVVLLSEKKDVTSLYKSLSTQLHKHLTFAQVHADSVPDAKQVLGADEEAGLPLVMVIKSEGDKEVYDGALKAPALLAFLKKHAPAAAGSTSDTGSSSSGGGGKGSKASEPEAAEVTRLTAEQLKEWDVKEDMALVAVQTGDEEACAALTKQFSQAASDIDGMMPLGVAHFTTEQLQQVSHFGIEAAVLQQEAGEGKCSQRLVLLPFGSDKQDLDEYQVYSDDLESKSLYKWTTSLVPSLFTVEVNPVNAQQFMAAGAPPGAMPTAGNEFGDVTMLKRIPPKVVLFTNKDEVPAVYKALALAFQGSKGQPGMLFGWVRAHTDEGKLMVQSLKPHKVPSVMMLLPVPREIEGKDGKKVVGMGMGAQPYMGPTSFKGMYQWLTMMLTAVKEAYGATDSPGTGGPAIPEITSQDDLATHCADKGTGLCFIALLDGNKKTSVESQVQTMSSAAAAFKEHPLYFSWLDAAKFTAFAGDLSLTGADLPTVVAVSVKHMRYAVLPAPLSGLDALSSFIDSVMGGRTRTTPLQALPRVSSSGDAAYHTGSSSEEPAPGADEPALQDEFDLSDIMSEEVESADVVLSKEEKLKQLEEELKAKEAEQAAAKKKSKKKKKKKSKAAKEEL